MDVVPVKKQSAIVVNETFLYSVSFPTDKSISVSLILKTSNTQQYPRNITSGMSTNPLWCGGGNHAQVTIQEGDTPTVAIVDAVAAATGTDLLDLRPLHEAVDTDAIDAIVRSSAFDD